MKSRILNIILLIVVGILIYIIINRPAVVPVEGNVPSLVDGNASYDGAIENIDRGKLIKQVIKGDAEAAMKLERYYGVRNVPEASLYWLQMAKKMGRPNVSQSLIDACEKSILNEFREPEK